MKKSDLGTTDPIPSYFGGFGPPARFRQKANPVDAQKYDYHAARTHVSPPNSVWESVIHLMMLSVSALVMNSHEAYMKCGALSAIPVNIVLMVVVGYCVCIFIWSAQKLYGRVQMPKLSYPDIAEATLLLSPFPKLRKCARPFRYLVEGTLIINLYGNCMVCSLMVARSLKQMVEGQTTDIVSDDGDPPLRIYILSLLIPFAVVVMVTDLQNLAPFAIIANFSAGVITFMVVTDALAKIKLDINDLPIMNSPKNFFEFIGSSVFALEVIGIALSVENNMANPKKFHHIILIALPTITFTMMLIGVFGYWHYRDKCMGPITLHFYNFSPVFITTKVFLTLMLYLVYSISFSEAFEVEWFYLRRNHQVSNNWFWERLYRTIHVVAITCTAYLVPDLMWIMSVIGSSCTTPLIFIYPTFIELILDWEVPGLGIFKWRLLKCIFFWMNGLSIFFPGIFYSVYGKAVDILAELQRHNF